MEMIHKLGQLKPRYVHEVKSLTHLNTVHVYFDGSVLEDGRAGCVVITQFTEDDTVTISSGGRLNNHVSLTQAKLWENLKC